MLNNLQANSLLLVDSFELKSIPIEFSKKDIVRVKDSSFLEINSSYIYFIDSSNYIYKIISDSSYIFAFKSGDIKRREFKEKKNSLVIKLNVDREISLNKSIISKNPIYVTIFFKNRKLATAYMSVANKIYLEIKELL